MAPDFWRMVSALLWVTLLALSLLLAPPADEESTRLVGKLVTGQFAGVNPALVALFNLMGVVPMCLVGLLALDGPRLRWGKWFFLAGSLLAGAFVLLPYLGLRNWDAPRERDSFLARVVEHRLFAAVLLALGAALAALFLLQGDMPALAAQWRTSSFVFVMSLDFVACTVAGVLLALEDTRLTGGDARWLLALLPAVGLPAYLFVRRRS